jgi:hypothetical protein
MFLHRSRGEPEAGAKGFRTYGISGRSISTKPLGQWDMRRTVSPRTTIGCEETRARLPGRFAGVNFKRFLPKTHLACSELFATVSDG